jgi:hypothetical protein
MKWRPAGRQEWRYFVNATDISTDQCDLQARDEILDHVFSQAEKHVVAAMVLIEEGRRGSASGAMKTCSLLLDLLDGVRVPLCRLGRIGQVPTGAAL